VTHRAFRRLAELTGEPLGELERWWGAGLLRVDEAEPALLERLRIIQLLRRRGFDMDALAATARTEPGLFDRYVDLFAPKGDLHRLEDAAAAHGLDRALVQRFTEAAGLADQGNLGDDEDVAALGALAAALRGGLPPDALVQLMRVYADAMTRVAEAEARVFHFHVHERLRAEGATGDQLAELTSAGVSELLPLSEPAVAYFHRKALGRAVREDLALHLAEDAGLIPSGDTSGRVPLAVAFVDLSSFTPMTEAMGDLAAAEILDRFSQLVRRAVLVAGGRVVKQIGDEFMLVFPDAGTAVRAVLDIRHATEREPAFLATRIGVHHGSVVCREGDYVGATVNLAARITSQAAAHQVLVSEAVRRDAAVLEDVSFTAVGTRALKGIDEEVVLFEAQRPHLSLDRPQAIDPVCGMVVQADAAPARLAVGDSEVLFCSQRCLRRYVADQQGDGPQGHA
jgi:adenylate cyclase